MKIRYIVSAPFLAFAVLIGLIGGAAFGALGMLWLMGRAG